jgi:arginase family enzyme
VTPATPPRGTRRSARRARKASVVFWPFGLFGTPGAEAGAHDLHDALLASLSEAEDAAGSRLAAAARTAEIELRPFATLDEIAAFRELIGAAFAERRRRGELPIFVGGNHLVALPVYDALAAERGRACVVSFDAHIDAYHATLAAEDLNHGNFLLHVRGRERLSIVNVGHRDLATDERRATAALDAAWPAEAIAARPLGDVIAEIAAHLAAFDAFLLDIDLDVLDPAALRAVGSPLPFGLAPAALLAIVLGLLSERTAGVTITEYDGRADADGAGKHLVVRLIERLLVAERERTARRA